MQMTEIKYGWKCPQCNTVHAPSQGTCPICTTPSTYYSWTGTVSLGGVTFSPGFGTVFMGPRVKTEAEQAQEAVGNWRAKGFSAKTLIVEAVKTLIDEDEWEEDDEGEDDDED